MTTCVRHAILGITALLVTSVASPAGAAPHHRAAQAAETVAARPAGTPADGNCLAQRSAGHDL